MATDKPRLIIAEERRRVGLDATTWEQRQGFRDRNGARIEGTFGIGMSAKELIKAMGALHVKHPDYKSRDYTLNPEPNLAQVQPIISGYKAGFWAELRRAFRWSA